MTDAQDLETELGNVPEDSGSGDSSVPSEKGAPSGNSGFGGTSDDSALSDDFANLATEIAKLKETVARSQADYKNLLSRTERERHEMADFVTEKLVLKLLPSIDNLERLLSGTPESEATGAFYDGVKSTFLGLVKTLESIGVSAFGSVGEALDPAFHEAIARVP